MHKQLKVIQTKLKEGDHIYMENDENYVFLQRDYDSVQFGISIEYLFCLQFKTYLCIALSKNSYHLKEGRNNSYHFLIFIQN